MASLLRRVLATRAWLYSAWASAGLVGLLVAGYAGTVAAGRVSCATSAALEAFAPSAVALVVLGSVGGVAGVVRAVVLRSLREGILAVVPLLLVAAIWLASMETLAEHGIACAVQDVDWPPCLFGCAD
jgi:hypothetical protein